VHSSEMSTVEFSSTGRGNIDDDFVLKAPGTKPGSEGILDREAKVLANLGGIVGPELLDVEDDGTLRMSRIGTHDLSDMMHDMCIEDIEPVASELVHQVNDLHEKGYVHRDIKPGNVMLTVTNGRILGVAGLVDFGMTVRINRKQKEKGVIGGTEPYSHPTQTSLDHRETQVKPGQDWYAVGRTILHMMIGGSNQSLGAFIQACSTSDVDGVIRELQQSWSGDIPQPLCDLIRFSIEPNSGTVEALERLQELGIQCASSIERQKSRSSGRSRIGFQKNANSRPKRHDMLIIVDSTGSMTGEIEDLKMAFREVAGDLSHKIDLRIDLWSMGDYNRDDTGESTIVPLGERMRGDTFRDAVTRIDANRVQHDEAEAYEVALQEAYLQRYSKWNPRINTTRTIVLIGDAYAHGWLKKNCWASHFGRAYKGQNAWQGKPAKPPDESMQKIYEDFQRRHEGYLTKPIRDEEEKEFKRAKDAGNRDDFGSKGHVEVQGERHKNRPNFEKAISKCVTVKNARIHTIASGDNLVNHSFMKYVAMIGKGTYTHIKQGELKIALSGLLAIADPDAFRELKDRVESTNPTTQSLNSITTFVLDSEEEENF